MHPRAMIVVVAASIAAASASEAGRKIFSDQTCEVISADISPKVTEDIVHAWQFGTNDFGYPRAEAYVSFLHYDGQSLQILLKEGDRDGQKTLVPIGGKTYSNGQSLLDEIADSAYYYYPREDDDHFQLLNAVIAYDPHSTLFTNYAVFISDKSEVKEGRAKWYQIQGTRLFSEDGFTEIPSSDLWFYTKEILLIIQHFVKCPNQPKQPAPNLPDPIQFTEQTEGDLEKQGEFFDQHKCKVVGSDIVYDGIKKQFMYRECRSAFMHEVKRVCGKHYKSEDPTKTRCLIHGAISEIDWKLPRYSTILKNEPEMWAVAIVSEYENDFQFHWTFHMSIGDHPFPLFGGMIMIFTIDNPDECEYQLQFGEDKLKPGTDPSKAVIRYDFTSMSYPNTDRSKVPDAWIYPSWAANKCGLRLLSQYFIQPATVPKRVSIVPKECSIQEPLLKDGLTLSRLKQWRFRHSNQGILLAEVCAVPYHWDGSDLLFARDSKGSFFCQRTDVHLGVGYTLEYIAALTLRSDLGDVRAKDMALLAAGMMKSDTLAVVFAVFFPDQHTMATWSSDLTTPVNIPGLPSDVLSRVSCTVAASA